uniref:Uncharacterized protein n=1 Tax=Arundo donax TaxID=35708 RepID=A0A0A8YLW9_ARUDO
MKPILYLYHHCICKIMLTSICRAHARNVPCKNHVVYCPRWTNTIS